MIEKFWQFLAQNPTYQTYYGAAPITGGDNGTFSYFFWKYLPYALIPVILTIGIGYLLWRGSRKKDSKNLKKDRK